MKYYFIISLIILAFLYTAATVAAPAAPEPVGRVVWVQGSFQAVQPNEAPRTLTQNAVIYLHDTLSTGGGAQAQIVFTDNTVMTFRENTKLYVDHYSFDPNSKKASVGSYFMDLIEGGFRTITGLIAKSNPTDYSVNTPVATIGVRGTDYDVVYDLTTSTLYVKNNHGTPFIQTPWGNLLLNGNVRFGQVSKGHRGPVRLSKMPAKLKITLKIIPVKLTPFQPPAKGTTQPKGGVIIPASSPSSGGTTPPPSTSGTTTTLTIGSPSTSGNTTTPTGTVSSFCIK